MTPSHARSRPQSSDLLRFLASRGLIEPQAHAQDLGQQLGDWLDVRQAIALQAFMGTLDDPACAPITASARVDARVLGQRFAQVRNALEQAILTGAPPAPGLARIEAPPEELQHPMDPSTAFEPFRRYWLAQQRQMEGIIRTLRSQLRGMLDKGPTPHRQLATLDALFEQVLSPREARWLGQLPSAFEPRFGQALQSHLQQCHQAAHADEPAPRSAPWLGPLMEDMRTALLAELDLRLQPVLGLIDALSDPHTALA